MVFRKESKVDAFQRQISALRQQLGTDEIPDEDRDEDSYYDEPEPELERPAYAATDYRTASRDEYSFASAGSSFQLDAYEPDMSGPPNVPEVDAQTSVVAHDTTWNGDLSSSGSLHVHGVVEGSLTAKDDVYIAEEAEVSATISATNVIVAGQVRGTIRCGARFEVLPQGRVFADVHAPSLIVHEGAAVNGQVRMGAPVASAESEEPPPAVVHRRAARNRA